MTTTENTTGVYTMTMTVPAIRRTDKVQARIEDANRVLADALAGLTRAELGVMREVLSRYGAATMRSIEAASYTDGYDAEDRSWARATRRLSEVALEKAMKSLWAKGLLRINGVNDADRWGGPLWDYSDQYGHSGVELHAGNSEVAERGASAAYTAQQVAGAVAAWLSGLTDEGFDPRYAYGFRDLHRVEILPAAWLADAHATVEAGSELMTNVLRVQNSISRIATQQVAEVIKPEPVEMLRAVQDAYNAAGANEADAGQAWEAMAMAITQFRNQAVHGLAPDNTMTPEQFANQVTYYTNQVDEMNAAIIAFGEGEA